MFSDISYERQQSLLRHRNLFALTSAGLGLALVIANGQLVQLHDPAFLALGADDVLGIPVSVLIAVVLAVAVAALTNRTTFGRQLVAVGGNRRAAALAGLPVNRVLIGVYTLCGVLAAVLALPGVRQFTDPPAVDTTSFATPWAVVFAGALAGLGLLTVLAVVTARWTARRADLVRIREVV